MKYIFIFVIAIVAQDLESLILEKEQSLKTLADNALNLYQNRCGTICEQSYSSCKSEFDREQTRCVETFGIPKYCGIGCKGRKLAEHTTWRTPSRILEDDPIVKESECWSQKLDDKFPDIYTSEKDSAKWSYIGLPSGGFRIYPGVSQKECYDYDPRIRPWYVAATSGPKDVILVIDVSGSMYENDRIELTIDAVNAVIDTLGNADFFNVVLFSRSAMVLEGDKLLKVNDENKKLIKDDISSIVDYPPKSINGGTNFESGFQMAFNLFDSSSEATSSCKKTILFMTDGQVTYGKKGDALYNMINNRNQNHNAIIFTYSLGAGASSEVPKAIACANNGIWSKIPDGGNLQGYMSRYYDYFSRFRQITSDTDVQAYWTFPYEDATGAGEMITGAYPVYDISKKLPILVGVVGIDVLTKDLREIEPDYENFVKFLAQRSSFCPDNVEIDICDLEYIRQLDDKGSFHADDEFLCNNNSTNCNFTTPSVCNQDHFVPYRDLFADSDKNEKQLYHANTCCERCLSVGAFSAIIIAAIVSLTVIICGIVLIIKYYKKKYDEPIRDIGSDGRNIQMDYVS